MAAVAKKRKAVQKPVCKYGINCYRKNAKHLNDYGHPGRDVDEDSDADDGPQIKLREAKQTKVIDAIVLGSDEEDSPPKKKKIDCNSSLEAKNTQEAFPGEDNENNEEETNGSDGDLEEPPASPGDMRENIKLKFLVEMPEDFYQFWEFCKMLNSSSPARALEKTLQLYLVGPFDILSGRHKDVQKNKKGRRPNFLLHYRFFYDPPEFQTVISANDETKFHLGYFRDDPKENPVFVASNSPGETSKGKLYPCGENIFAAVYIHASKKMKLSSGDTKKSLEELMKSIEREAKKHDLSLEAITKQMKERQKKVVCPTFHGAGIVVPVDANEVGYRPVPETPGDLRAMFKKITEGKSESEKEKSFEDLQELITLVQFANDECDYGEGLELGLDLFTYGSQVFHPQIESLMPLAYQLLNRHEFSKIIEAHLKHRQGVTQNVDELAT